MSNFSLRTIGKPNPHLLALKKKRKEEREAGRQAERERVFSDLSKMADVQRNMFDALKQRLGGEDETNDMFARRILDILEKGTDRDVIRLLDVTAKYTVAPPARRVEHTVNEVKTLVLDLEGIDPALLPDDMARRVQGRAEAVLRPSCNEQVALENGTDTPRDRPAALQGPESVHSGPGDGS